MTKKIALFVCALFLLSALSMPVFAGGIIGDLQTDVSAMNELSARVAVNQYFSQRLDYLSGNAADIPIVNRYMFADEQIHRQNLLTQGLTIQSSQITVESIFWWSNMATVTVTESVTYSINEFSTDATISHDLTMSLGADNRIVIQSDLYHNPVSGFSSASYISPEEYAAAELNAGNNGDLCIVNIAYNERGTTRGEDGDVKYRKWYQTTYGHTYNLQDAWCAMFVSWCARHAGVSSSVLPSQLNVPNMVNDYSSSRYALKKNHTPQSGDLIFINSTTPNSDIPTHVGIVHSVTGAIVNIVDGNWHDSVHYRSLDLNDTSIVGYAWPAYAMDDEHIFTIWSSNENKHWRLCSCCGYRDIASMASHTLSSAVSADHSYHWFACTVCGRQFEKSAHTIVTDPATLWNYCSVCGFDGPPYN